MFGEQELLSKVNESIWQQILFYFLCLQFTDGMCNGGYKRRRGQQSKCCVCMYFHVFYSSLVTFYIPRYWF